ncbi:hypothetical protein HK098_007739 [Nowakowskiella sp. JEL0407]|nr:hypothetical protein HK098_007739 [Nowakowskiella sp. JEL0407]
MAKLKKNGIQKKSKSVEKKLKLQNEKTLDDLNAVSLNVANLLKKKSSKKSESELDTILDTLALSQSQPSTSKIVMQKKQNDLQKRYEKTQEDFNSALELLQGL